MLGSVTLKNDKLTAVLRKKLAAFLNLCCGQSSNSLWTFIFRRSRTVAFETALCFFTGAEKLKAHHPHLKLKFLPVLPFLEHLEYLDYTIGHETSTCFRDKIAKI